MKVHITKSYLNIDDENFIRQKLNIEAAAMLGTYEMGIPECNNTTLTSGQIFKILDGIIAAVEFGDLTIVQLPTGNGVEFEHLLLDKILAYSGNKAFALWNDESYYVDNHDKLATQITGEYCITENDDVLNIQQIFLNYITLNDTMSGNQIMDSEEYIHIAFGLTDKTGSYFVWTLAAIESIIENTDVRVFFHIICDDTIPECNKAYFYQIIKNGCHKLEFNVINADEFIEIEKMAGHFSIATYFRTKIPKLYPQIERLIYLDSDIFVNLDIKELWEADISNYYIAAVKDPGNIEDFYPIKKAQLKEKKYFNAGVLYMNLDMIRKNGDLQQQIVEYCIDNPEAPCPDQDALNVIYQGKVLWLDEKYNHFILASKDTTERKIYHFAATLNILYDNSPVDYKYNELLTRLSYDNQFARESEDRSKNKLIDRKNYLFNFIKAIQKGKQIVFYGADSYGMRNMIKKIYGESDKFVRIDSFTSEEAENISDSIVVVSHDADNGDAMSKLEAAGFINGETYFVLMRLLHYKDGGFAF